MAYDPLQNLQQMNPQYSTFNPQGGSAGMRGQRFGQHGFAYQQNPMAQMQGQSGYAAPYQQWQQFGPSGEPWKKPAWGSEWNLGSSDKYTQVPTVTPFVSSILNQIAGGVMQDLNTPYGTPTETERRSMQNFYENIVPQLARQFSYGTGADLSSPSYVAQLGQAGVTLQQNLQNNRTQDILERLKFAMQPQFETNFQAGQPGFWENLVSGAVNSAAQGFGKAGGSWLGGKTFK